MKVWELIVGAIAAVSILGFVVFVAIVPTDVERLTAQNRQQEKIIKTLERADRAITAGCDEAMKRTLPVIAALEILEGQQALPKDQQLLPEDQIAVGTRTLVMAEELSFWMKYCIPKGYLLQQKLVGAVQKNDLGVVRESLSQFRSGAIVVEKDVP